MFYSKKKVKTIDRQIQERLDKQLRTILEKYLYEHLTPITMKCIREDIIFCVKTLLSEEAITKTAPIYWLSDFIFKRIKLNGDMLMSDQVVINEYKISELSTSDIFMVLDIMKVMKENPETKIVVITGDAHATGINYYLYESEGQRKFKAIIYNIVYGWTKHLPF
jgi:hypothetical protein